MCVREAADGLVGCQLKFSVSSGYSVCVCLSLCVCVCLSLCVCVCVCVCALYGAACRVYST